MPLNVFKDSFETFLQKNLPSQRGLYVNASLQPNLLPIPYPRFFNERLFNEYGMLKVGGFDKKEFINTVPSLVKTMQSSNYLPTA